MDKVLPIVQDHSIGGQSYKFGPITLSDIGQCVRWAKEDRLRMVLSALPADATEDRLRAMREIPDTISDEAVQKELSRSWGLARLLWIANRKADKTATLEDWEGRVTMATFKECEAIVDTLSGAGGMGGPAGNV